jgi:hypothetical protein
MLAPALALVATVVSADFHTFKIEQIFSNSSGTVQFIVLHEAQGMNSENYWMGHALTSTHLGTTQTYTFGSNLPGAVCDPYYGCGGGGTADSRVLVATQGFADLHLITPDFVVPNGFLAVDGGTINYAGVDQVTYGALPTDGVTAIDRNGATMPNLATNFSRQSASVRSAAPPGACTLTATPSSLPAGGGTVVLGVSCAAGGAPTSYNWSASPSVTFTGGINTVASTNSALITQTTAFTIVASNAAGSSPPATASIQVAGTITPPLTPPGTCTLSATPSFLPAGGGNVTLTGSCATGGAPDGFFWTGGFVEGRISPVSTLSGNVTQTTVFTFVAKNAGGSSPTVAVTVSVAASPPPPPPPSLTPDLNQHGLTGSWYEPATSGQGLEVEVFPNPSSGTSSVFVSWFTYDPGIGGAERQRWYTAQGPVATGQPTASLTIYQNTGGNFNAAPVTSAQVVGTATLSFDTCASGQLTYSFTDGTGRRRTIPLKRLTQNVTCSTTTAYPTNADFALSGNWFGGAATSGQGFTVEVNPNSGALFAAWYTYMPNGTATGAAGQRWYTAQAAFTPGMRSMPVTIYETTGGVFDIPTPPGQKTVPVGTGTMAFQSCSAATFSYNFTGGSSSGLSGTIPLSRVGPMPPGCTT